MNTDIGTLGEDIACAYLISHGYRIVKRNVRNRWGEIDIVCEHSNALVLIEVKTRLNTNCGLPYESITRQKLFRLMRVFRHLPEFSGYKRYRIDAISVVLSRNNEVKSIHHYTDISQ